MIDFVDKKHGLQITTPAIISGGSVDLSNYYTKDEVNALIPDVSGFISEIPEEYVTETELDAKGYLTQHQDISGLATKSEVADIESKIPNLEGYATEQWVEGKGYLTEHQSLENYAFRSEIPTKTSELTNDSGYLTEHQSLDGYAKTEDIPDVSAYQTEAQVQALIDTAIAGITDGEAVSY